MTAALLMGVCMLAHGDDTDLQQEARALVAEFVSTLKPQLKSAMVEGGPAHAISVCSTVAPRLADTLSAKSGWQVRRVSLKTRNASRAVPDAWEREMLKAFDQRQERGEMAANLNVAAIVGGDYRYMQAQGVEPVCLACHGETLAEPVKQALETHYPDDMATGYRLGEVRGAISLSKRLP
jgi:hypothetical protein